MPITDKKLRYPAITDSPNIPLDFQKLAQDVDAALPGAWVTITQSNPNYLTVPATTWTTLTDYAGATVTVPSGRTMDVEFKVPFITAGVNSRCDLRLKIGSASYPDSATLVTAGADTQVSCRQMLTASVVGTGVGVSVSVEAIRVGSAEVKGNGVTGPSLRYRIV